MPVIGPCQNKRETQTRLMGLAYLPTLGWLKRGQCRQSHGVSGNGRILMNHSDHHMFNPSPATPLPCDESSPGEPRNREGKCVRTTHSLRKIFLYQHPTLRRCFLCFQVRCPGSPPVVSKSSLARRVQTSFLENSSHFQFFQELNQ